MKSLWLEIWPHLRLSLRYLVYGVPLALIPFLLNWQRFWQQGNLLSGFLISLGFGMLVAATVWVTFMLAYLALAWVHQRSGYFPRTRWWFNLCVALCGTLLGIGLMMSVQSWLWSVPFSRTGFFFSLTIGLICLTVFMLYSLYQEARAEALQQQAAVAEARYHTLETQMRPHFLFNALNSLAELIEAKQENAAEVAFTLSDLYRKILANSKTKTSSLASEVEITRAYLELEHLRFGERLRYTFHLPPNAAEIYLPSLTLQTLVENAVKHGIAKSLTGGEIEIHVQQQAPQHYQLRVVNSGLPLSTTDNSHSTGLANTRERLELMYGPQHQFQLATDEAGRTCASFYFTGEKRD